MNKTCARAALLLSLFVTLFSIETEASPRIRSAWAATPPTIDGSVANGEWAGAEPNKHQFPQGWILALNDNTNLYLLIDLPTDAHNDPPLTGSPWGDFLSLSFDVNGDKAITPNLDLSYGIFPGTYNMGLQLYLSPASWTGLRSTGAKLGAGFRPTLAYANFNHRFWEIGIPLSEIGAGACKPVYFGVKTYSQTPAFNSSYPQGMSGNFSNLVEIVLAAQPAASDSQANRVVQRKILPDGGVETRYADGTIKRVYDNRIVTIAPDGTTSAVIFISAQYPSPPSPPPGSTLNNWFEKYADELLGNIKAILSYDQAQIDTYLELERNRTTYEKVVLRLRCIMKLIGQG